MIQLPAGVRHSCFPASNQIALASTAQASSEGEGSTEALSKAAPKDKIIDEIFISLKANKAIHESETMVKHSPAFSSSPVLLTKSGSLSTRIRGPTKKEKII